MQVCYIYNNIINPFGSQNQSGEKDWIGNAGRHKGDKGEGADQTPHVLQQGLDREGDNMGP